MKSLRFYYNENEYIAELNETIVLFYTVNADDTQGAIVTQDLINNNGNWEDFKGAYKNQLKNRPKKELSPCRIL